MAHMSHSRMKTFLDKEIDLFIELLQVALGTREQLSRVASVHDWTDLYAEAERQAVTGIFLEGLERLPKEQLPQKDFLLQWVGVSQMIESNYAIHCDRSRTLVRLVSEAGFSSCVIKGISVARYYPKPERRQCGDIDLWVDGPRKDVMKWLNQFKIEHQVWHNVGVHIFKDVPVEIHFHPGWLYNPIHNNRLQKWFEQVKSLMMVNVDSTLCVPVPTDLFNAVYSLIHSFRHLIAEGVGLRHIVDYFYIVRSLTEDNREEVIKLLRKFGLTKFAGGMMWVMQEVCGMPSENLLVEPNEREGRFIFEEIMRGGNFGHYKIANAQRGLFSRMWVMLPHYPSEVLWIIPWKVWHVCWRMTHKY